MDFFDKLGKKATEAYKVTADKTGKIAKETKLKLKIGDLKSKIEDVYKEIGKAVYQKHMQKEEFSIEKDVAEQCKIIDDISEEIKNLLQQSLELRDKKQCIKCFKEINIDTKFCPECGTKQETENSNEIVDNEEVKEKDEIKSEKESLIVAEEEIVNDGELEEEMINEEETREEQTNLEKTTEVEINPDAQNITEEEMKNIGI